MASDEHDPEHDATYHGGERDGVGPVPREVLETVGDRQDRREQQPDAGEVEHASRA